MNPVIIIAIAFVLLIPISINAQVNPYEIIEVSLNKKFVQENERIEVSGNVKNFNPDFKNLIRILETKDGHRIDYDTAPVDKDDGSFEFYWQVGAIYDSTWVSNSEYVIKINYAGIDNWKELEFVYCDKRQQKSQAYLKLCQEAFGYVETKNIPQETPQLENTGKQQTLTMVDKDGAILENTGKDPTGSDLWVETEASYFNRLMIPLIFNIIVIGIIIGIIVLVIYKVITRSKSKQIEIKSFSKGQLSYLRNSSAEDTIKFFIQHEYGDQKRLNDILKSIEVNELISDSDKKYILNLLEKTRNWENR